MALHDEETIEEYCKGGHYPTAINEVLNGKYQVKRKLGWGHFSTVWLCLKLETKEYYAIKIVKSAENYREAALDEIEFLETLNKARLSNNNPDCKNSKYVTQLIDSFYIRGDEDKHICLVFEVLGQNMLTFLEDLHLNFRKKIKRKTLFKYLLKLVQLITQQVIKGLEFMHSNCGIIHTDIKPENILFALNEEVAVEEPNCLDKEKLPKIKKSQPIITKETTEIIRLIKQDRYDDFLKYIKKNIRVKIADLGNACYANKHITNNIQTRQYRSPEVILDYMWNETVDIWSVGCVVFEILTGEYLFDPRSDSGPTGFNKEDDHLALMIELLGEPPAKMIRLGKASGDFFSKKDCKLKRINQDEIDIFDIRNILMKKFRLEENNKELASFVKFMERCIRYDPQKRYTAHDLLKKDPFVNEPL